MAHPPELRAGARAEHGHQGLPAAADLNGRAGDAQLPIPHRHPLQQDDDVIARPGSGQGLQGSGATPVQTGGHHVGLGLRPPGLRPEVDVGAHRGHQPFQVGQISPAQAHPLTDQPLLRLRGLLGKDPHPVVLRSLGIGDLHRGGQHQTAHPLGAGAIEIGAGALAEGIALRTAPGGAAGQRFTALGQGLGGGAQGRWARKRKGRKESLPKAAGQEQRREPPGEHTPEKAPWANLPHRSMAGRGRLTGAWTRWRRTLARRRKTCSTGRRSRCGEGYPPSRRSTKKNGCAIPLQSITPRSRS